MKQRALKLALCPRNGLHINSSRSAFAATATRSIQIQTTPTTPTLAPSTASAADARFEVLSPHSSLLSVTLSASQPLHTRRGTLAALHGSPDHAISTLTPLSPLARAPLGIPFLYQRITSATPLTLLLAPKRPHTAVAVLHLDGTTDWTVFSRTGLLAWTGTSLTPRPHVNAALAAPAFAGSTTLTGRGLVALSGAGALHTVVLKEGESFVAHPGAVLAFANGANPPLPFRFRSSSLRLQVPSLGNWLPDNVRFVRVMRESKTWRTIGRGLFVLRTWLRRTIWGDRLFLRFHGPSTIIMQSRGSRLRDVLTDRDVNEMADTEAGSLSSAVTSAQRADAAAREVAPAKRSEPKVSTASVDKDGKVNFDKGGAKPGQ